MTVDLNAARAARRETLGESPKLVFGDPPKSFQCPPELPFDALVAGTQAEQGDAGAAYDFVRELVGEKGVKAFRDWKPSLEDVRDLVNGVMEEYGQERPTQNGDGPAGAGDDAGEARG